METKNLAVTQLFARFPSQLQPAERNVDFPNNLFSVEEILHLNSMGCIQSLQ